MYSKIKQSWYSRLCRDADLMMNGSVKGTMILQPYGLKIWRLIQQKINKKLGSLDFQEIVLPTLIAPGVLEREQAHLKGFKPELFCVVYNGAVVKKEIGVLRPTSELLVCEYFQKKLSRYTQLPFLYYQWGSVFRAEKNTKPFLRNCEFWWQEGHTLHEDQKNAQLFVNKIHKFYIDFIANTCLLNFLAGAKTNLEKFAGARATYAVETILPDGQALQCATTHDLGTNFSQPFGIKFQTAANIYDHPFQTSFGISSRIIGALVMEHSDQFGLLLPSQLCPVNIMIITRPSIAKTDFIASINQLIKKMPFTSDIFITDNPKQAFNKLVCRGTTLIIIVSEITSRPQSVKVYVRYLNKCMNVGLEQLFDYLITQISRHDQLLQKRSTQLKIQKTIEISSLNQLAIAIKNQQVARAFFALNQENEIAIKQATTATIRCVKSSSRTGNCFYSQKPCNTVVYLSKSY